MADHGIFSFSDDEEQEDDDDQGGHSNHVSLTPLHVISPFNLDNS